MSTEAVGLHGTEAGRFGADRYAFVLAFKGVLLEGLEVAFIVVTFGANQGSIPLAVLGAALAVVAVTVTGVAVRAPLARVPENTMKFAVGVMLTSFGTFWAAQGAGVRWPGEDIALLAVLAYVLTGLRPSPTRHAVAGLGGRAPVGGI